MFPQAAILKAPLADYVVKKAPCDLITVGQPFATNFFGMSD